MRTASLIRRIPAGRLRAPPPLAATAPGAIHLAILAVVWATFALSGVVFSEPAPVDMLLIGLIILLPTVGLVTITPVLTVYLSLWCIAAASGFLTSTLSRDIPASTVFTAISLYLYVASFVLGAFVARAPERHTELILSGWMIAAVIAAATGLIGYFKLVPGAYEMFTKFERAAGTFKDPNVFGPFLVAPFLYALHLVLTRPWYRSVGPLAIAGLLAIGVLLSFSRGAWINLALALVVYGTLAYATAPTAAQRQRIVLIVATGTTLVALLTLAVLQDDKIGGFFAERATLTQSYDVGPAGRFGGQEKAIRLLLDHPFGIGAGQFTSLYHHEEVHNVFLSMFHNAGWLGGFTYWLMVGLTLVIGAQHLTVASSARPLFIIAYASFLATAFEGIIVDTDHWRSFYILMAIVWGMASAPVGDGRDDAAVPMRSE
jgi:O-Antigen ligase